MLHILDRICEGKGTEEDVSTLERLARGVAATSLCGLGQNSPNPVLTTLKFFREEYMAHVIDRKCPAGVCKALITYRIDPEICTGCGVCLRNCPTGAISGERKSPHTLNAVTCIKCGACREGCRFDAVVVG